MGIKIKAFKTFAADAASEEEGKWAPIVEGVEFKIRRLRSKAVQEAQRKIYGPHERAMRGKDLPDAIETMCTIRLLSEAVIVDWRGDEMKDEKGKPVPFSPETCAELLSDPETGRDLRATVLSFTADSEFYAPEDQAADLGNSSAT